MIGTQTLSQHAQKGRRHAPLSSHPAFAPLFILWCAAMLGMPVVAVSGAALESWVTAAHIDSLLPAAAPPLGAFARLLLAAGFALVGAAVGWVVTRLLRPAPVREGDEIQLRQRDRHPDAPARRPISAHAELGDEGLGGMTGERDMFPDDLSPYRTPVEETPRHGGFAPEPAPWPAPSVLAEATPVFTAPAAPLFAATVMAPEPSMVPTPAPEHADAYDLPEIDFAGLMDAPHAPVAVVEETPAPALEPTEDDWHALPPVVSETDLRRVPGRLLTAVPTPVAPAPVVPIASALSRRTAENRVVENRTVEKPAPVEAPALIGATPVQPRASASERIVQTSLGELSHVELIERLALAIHSREKGVTPVAVNDAQDSVTDAAAQDGHDDVSATQASLRSALAGLREVK